MSADTAWVEGGIMCGRTVRPEPWFDPPPEGYHFEVWDDEPDWKYEPGTGRICRQLKCKNPGVAAINRGWRRRNDYGGKPRDSWWYYCAEHLYGRWIEDGKVCNWRLVLNSAGEDLRNGRVGEPSGLSDGAER